ncbi:DUF2158 domain-containing protein [Vibrio fluvialis]|nr:DUF2158 domain-containing protein [Vibrio fluvialis]MBY8266187.1 DUF2158 domain-containing protein [Vibrio fluvialis]
MFEVGEKVKLADGGLTMTVVNIIDDRFVECQWFDDIKAIHIHQFDINTLIKYEPVHIETPFTLW